MVPGVLFRSLLTSKSSGDSVAEIINIPALWCLPRANLADTSREYREEAVENQLSRVGSMVGSGRAVGGNLAGTLHVSRGPFATREQKTSAEVACERT